jgi:hypothetical protein
MEHFIFPKINLDYSKEMNINALTHESERVINDIYSAIDNMKIIKRSSKQSNIRKASPSRRTTTSPKRFVSSTKLTNSNYPLSIYKDTDQSIESINFRKNIITEIPKESNRETLFSFFNTELPTVKRDNVEVNEFHFAKPSERLSIIYKSFNGIGNEYYKLSNNIEKSLDKFKQRLYLLRNKEKIKQNKIIGETKAKKNYNLLDPPFKPKMIKELDKNEVLKDYHLINKIKDDYAEYVWKKFEKPADNSNLQKIKFQKNHKQILNILDSMKIHKKYK